MDQKDTAVLTVFVDRSTLKVCLNYKADSLQVMNAYRIGWARFDTSVVAGKIIKLGEVCVADWTNPRKSEDYSNYSWPGDKSCVGKYHGMFIRALTRTPPALVRTNVDEAYAECELELKYAGSFDTKLRTRELFSLLTPKLVCLTPISLACTYYSYQKS